MINVDRHGRYNFSALFCLSALLFFSVANAQTFSFEEEWRWSHFTTESGLPSNQIISMVESRSGTIWAATVKGIAWYDGYLWNALDTLSGLPHMNPTGIYRGIGDSVIVQYTSQTFVGTKKGFRRIFTSIDTKKTVSGGNTYGIHSYHSTLHFSYGDTIVNVNKPGYQIGDTRSDIMWYSADTGLYLRIGKTDIQKLSGDRYVIVDQFAENTKKNGIASISLPVEFIGIWEWDSSRIFKKKNFDLQNSVVTLDINEHNDVICIHESGEVRIRTNGVWSTPGYLPIQMHHCKHLFFASSGDLWLSTDQGIYVFKSTNNLWSFLTQPGFPLVNNINEIVPCSNGDLWLGTGDGILIFHPDKTIEHITSIAGTRLFAVTGLAQDKDGNMWVSSGSTFTGTFRWDGKTWTHRNFGNKPSSTFIHKIKKDRSGNLWFLCLSGKTAVYENDQPGVFLLKNREIIPWGDIHKLPRKRVYAFSESPNGTLWFGTSTGLFAWKPDSIHPTIGTWTSMKGKILWDRVFTLTTDQENNVWFGDQDYGKGLGKISPSGKVEYFTEEDGLSENHVNDVFVDSENKLWITANSGLSCFSKGIWTTYNEKTGLKTPKLWPIVAYKDQIVVGTIGKGLAILNRLIPIPPSPIIIAERPVVENANVLLRWKPFAYFAEVPDEAVLTRYRLNNGNWSPWNINRSLTFPDMKAGSYIFQIQAKGLFGQFNETGKLVAFVVPPPLWQQPMFFIPACFITVSFLGLSLSSYARKRISDAALRKSEEKFRAVAQTTPSAMFIYAKETEILYANPAAVYLTGYTIEELATMKFRAILHPRFENIPLYTYDEKSVIYQKEVKLINKNRQERWVEVTTSPILFQGISATLAAVFDVTDRKESEMQLRALTFELSRTEERERRRLATYLHDTIGQNLAFLKLKIRSALKGSDTAEQTKTANDINEIVESLIQDSQTLTFELSLPILYELGLEAALGWLAERIQERHGIVCKVNFNASAKSLQYELQTILFNTIRELVANCVKHAHASLIEIYISKSADCLSISVCDNGRGFTQEHLPRNSKKGGFGLFNVRQRISSLGGTFDIKNNETSGATITFSIPVTSTENIYGH